MLTPATGLRQSKRSVSPASSGITTVENVLEKLTKVRKQGQGWVACCPAHNDHSPSLSVRQGSDGKLLLHCFAGCSFEDILRSLGLEAKAFHSADEREWTDKGKPAYPTLQAASDAYSKGRPDRQWLYHNAAGNIVGAVCRWDGAKLSNGKCKKEIRPVRYDSQKDHWLQEQMPSPRPLWSLVPLLAADPDEVVYVCEGEKAAESGQKKGLLTTTSAGGANAAKLSDWKSLAGRRVVILPDFDKPGRFYASSVKALLHEAGAAEILWVDLPVTEEGDDLHDWLERGGEIPQLEVMVEEARERQAKETAEAEAKQKEREAKQQKREAKQKATEAKEKRREDQKAKAEADKGTKMRLDPEEEWQKTLPWRYGRGGEVLGLLPDTTVAMQILLEAPEWQGVLTFDEMALSPKFEKAPPFPAVFRVRGPFPRPFVDTDYRLMQSYFWRVWGFRLKLDEVCSAVEMAAEKTPVHPVREYLRSLAWDGVPRVGSWLRTYLGGKAAVSGESAYVDWVGQMWMISAVARAFQPGCKADHVLVLEGSEGLGKSSALSVLGGAFYSDAPLVIGEKDTLIGLQGRWIIELAEVEALLKTESSAAKAFFTRRTDRYRPLYAKKAIDVPRGCIFAGTANHNEYIKDTSGGRRYWPVWCTEKDLAGLARDRDQLWAEATLLYEQGALWHPEGEGMLALFQQEQEARQQEDVWEEAIFDRLQGKDEITIAEILRGLGKELKDIQPRDRQIVGIVLAKAGWKRHRRCKKGIVKTSYLRPDEKAAQPPPPLPPHPPEPRPAPSPVSPPPPPSTPAPSPVSPPPPPSTLAPSPSPVSTTDPGGLKMAASLFGIKVELPPQPPKDEKEEEEEAEGEEEAQTEAEGEEEQGLFEFEKEQRRKDLEYQRAMYFFR